MANRIQLRRDGAQQWANINPILAQGELGIEIDTSRIKIGDGVTPWNSLKYERPLETESNTANTLVKRDADGNFEAGAITASLVGNSSTATRLANARQISLGGDMSGSGTFDGSANLTITAELNYVVALPHYDENDLDATGTYTRITVDSRGRIVDADNPTTLAAFGIADAQPLDSDLTSVASMTSFGLMSRQAEGTITTRTITGGSGRIIVQNGNAQSANPFLDLADTTVVVGEYNPTGNLDTPLISVNLTGDESVNTTQFTTDRYGRFTYARTIPIATAKQGTESPTYDNAVAYSREDKVQNGSGRLYEAILDISAGGGEPTHTDTSDAGSWRYLGSALSPQKGLASFNQEDFDVTSWDPANTYEGGFVSIAAAGVDNWQLQNSRISFADGNTKEDFKLDQELTAVTGYRGFNYLNYVKVNDTSGNLLFGANNTGDSGAGEIDVNVRSYYSDPNIDLDGAVDQIIDKYGDGNLDINLTQNSASNRTFSIASTNAGGGSALLDISADNDITIYATDVNSRVNVEDFHFQDNVLSTTNATMVLDPNDDDDVTGLVRVRGDLQVDGTTTTVNSVTTTIQDPIITLGGEDTLTLDDNLDRGIEFRYYDTQERFGFFGWDEDYADANIWSGTGGYRFLYNATNTNEVYAGTDAALIAGNLRLTTNTGATSTTTGTLVVTGGVGISENLWVGGTVDIANDFDINSGQFTVTASNGDIYTQGDLRVDSNVILGDASTDTVLVNSDTTFEDDVRISGPNTVFTINDGSVTQFEVDTDNGNTVIQGTLNIISAVDFDNTLNVDGAVTFNSTFDLDDDAVFHNDITLDTTGKYFKITNGTDDKFTVLSTNGNTDIRGTLDVGSAVHFESTLQVDGNITLGDAGTDILTINSDTTITDNLTVNLAVDFDSTLNVDGAVDFNNTLTVDGATTIYNDVLLRSGNKTFQIQNGSAQTEFSVDFDNGNTVIGRVGQGTAALGTLTVHGDGTFNRDVFINGNTRIGDAATDTLTVNSVSTFTDDVTVNGDFTVDGNTVLEGNLTVNGTTTTINSTTQTLDDPVFTLGGDTAPSQADAKDRGIEFRYYDAGARVGFFGWDNSASRYALYHNATNSSEAFSGTRSGLDAGSIKLFDTTNSTSASTGTLIVGGGVGIGLDLYVGDDLTVTDDASFGGNVDITGTLDVTDDFAVSTNFTVDAQTGNTFVAGTFQVNGNSTIGNAGTDNHVVTGTVTFNQAITSTDITADQIRIGVDAPNEISTTAGNLILDSVGGTVNITDNLDVDLDLNVDGNTQIDGTLTVDGNATIGNAAGDSHVVTGTVQFNNAMTATDVTIDSITIGVVANNVIDTNSGALTFQSATGAIYNQANLFVTGTLQVDGNTTIGNAGTDSHVVNGTTTFNHAITSTDITADNIKIGVDASSEISTTAGALTLDSFTGETIVDDNLTVNGTFDVSGLSVFTNSITLNASSQNFRVQNGSAITKFSVASSTGNTDIQGTLNVEGASIIDDTLNVTGAVDLDSTLNVDGIATISNTSNASTGSNFSSSGALRVLGGISVARDLAIGGDMQIYGDFEVDGNVVQKGSQEFRGRVEFSNGTNPSSLSSNAAVRLTSGGMTVLEDVFFGQQLTLGPNNAGTITLDGTSGNVSVGGTLGVTGASTFSTISTSSITTTATANVGGSLLINTNKFTVQGTSGNTAIAGTLGVTGATTLNSTLNVVNSVDFDSTLNVDGAATFNSTITQNGTSRFNDNIVLQGASKTLQLNNGAGTTKIELQSTSGNITGAGLATLNSLEVTTNADVLGNLGVTGTITGDVTGDLTGTADKADLVNITETATSNLTYYVPFVSANTGYTEVRTDSTNLTYNPFENRLTVTNFKSTTDFEVAGNLNVTGNITYNLSQVGSIANHTTDGLPEGTSNLYFTDERVDDRVGALISGGTGISATYDDAGNLLTLSAVQSDINTDSITEGSTNLFTTATRTRSHFTYGTGITLSAGELSVVQSDINTDNVTEGSTNVFFTDARARGAFSAGGDLSYNASTGEFSFTERTDAEVNGLADARIALNVGANLDLSSKDTDDLSEGISNQYFTDARARSAISASGDISYTANTGVISFTERTDAEVNSLADARIALAAGDYATAAQGTLADSAIQPADLATVATTGAYSDLTGTPSLATVATTGAYADLTGTPTLGTAAAAATTDFATAAQGTQADTNDTDIDDLYTALNDIGNDNTITTLAQLKTALANLSR